MLASPDRWLSSMRERETSGCSACKGASRRVGGGGGRPQRPWLVFVHPFHPGSPELATPSQRRQGTAERDKLPQTDLNPGGGGGGFRGQKKKFEYVKSTSNFGPL